ncbi:MAG: HAMP domain-containing histidine kinase [Clostridiales bacterium]|jgi:signal transduction histidine kinase|nr:HAMP domain-containing histidine kinase [Clostridiales bacterium]
MIKKLKIKIILIIMAVTVGVFAIMFGVLNSYMNSTINRQTQEFRTFMEQREGDVGVGMQPRPPFAPPLENMQVRIVEDLLRISMMVGVFSGIGLLIFAIFFAKWSVKPVEAALIKQKRFISDAGHELKTPLTIISAESDLNGYDEIKPQIARMQGLLNDLLTLSHLDENPPLIEAEFDLSKALLEATLEFESRAFEAGKEFNVTISENIHIKGNEPKIKQLSAILIDNAIKHSSENGKIEVKLKEHNATAIFSVFNTGEPISEEEKSLIFDRFYRTDTSRTRTTGGHGLGLSIASKIAKEHKTRIEVENIEGGVMFSVEFSK